LLAEAELEKDALRQLAKPWTTCSRYTGVGTCEKSVDVREAEQRNDQVRQSRAKDQMRNQRMGPVRVTPAKLLQAGKVNESAWCDC
jgi:hypothetical protein